MYLNKVTITGADDTTDINRMVELQREFPFAEWGILLSRGSEGKNHRFPSLAWMEKLKAVRLRLSGHLCGKWVTELTEGNFTFLQDRPTIAPMFNRFQINFHGVTHTCNQEQMLAAINADKRQFIFQMDEINDHLLSWMARRGANVAALFDTSHGDGVLRAEWPGAIRNVYCGYAGGLSPDNVIEQLTLIDGPAGDTDYWIDAETHVRTDEKFDLEKVYQFLKKTKWLVEGCNDRKDTIISADWLSHDKAVLLRFADEYTAEVKMSALEKEQVYDKLDPVAVFATGKNILFVEKDMVKPLDGGTMRYLCDPNYAEDTKEALRVLQLSREELQELSRHSEPAE